MILFLRLGCFDGPVTLVLIGLSRDCGKSKRRSPPSHPHTLITFLYPRLGLEKKKTTCLSKYFFARRCRWSGIELAYLPTNLTIFFNERFFCNQPNLEAEVGTYDDIKSVKHIFGDPVWGVFIWLSTNIVLNTTFCVYRHLFKAIIGFYSKTIYRITKKVLPLINNCFKIQIKTLRIKYYFFHISCTSPSSQPLFKM